MIVKGVRRSMVFKTGKCPYCRRIKEVKWKHSCNNCKNELYNNDSVFIVVKDDHSSYGHIQKTNSNIISGKYIIVDPFMKLDR